MSVRRRPCGLPSCLSGCDRAAGALRHRAVPFPVFSGFHTVDILHYSPIVYHPSGPGGLTPLSLASICPDAPGPGVDVACGGSQPQLTPAFTAASPFWCGVINGIAEICADLSRRKVVRGSRHFMPRPGRRVEMGRASSFSASAEAHGAGSGQVLWSARQQGTDQGAGLRCVHHAAVGGATLVGGD